MSSSIPPATPNPQPEQPQQVHVIRLRGPWEYVPLVRWRKDPGGAVVESHDLPPSGRAHMPCDWEATLGADFRGRVRYTRRFNKPTNLDPLQRVRLACEGVDGKATVRLNGQPLGEFAGFAAAARFEITALLDWHNQLHIEVELPPGSESDERSHRGARAGRAGGLVGEVRLEIIAEVSP